MKIAIITVAYNSEKTIARTIESVLAQTYTEVEYWIVDGQSSDATVKIAQSYRSALEGRGFSYHVISEPDGGIYDAMNKGIQKAEGDIIGLLNSDDTYEPDTLQTVAETFQRQSCELLFGNIRMHRQDGSTFVKKAKLGHYETSRHWNHPTTFVKASVYKANPFRNLGIHDDYGFYLQMRRQGRKIVVVDKVLANFYMGGASNRKDLGAARRRIMDRYRYCYRINGYSRLYFLECVAMEMVKLLFG